MKAANEGKVPQDADNRDVSSSEEGVTTGAAQSETGTDDLLEKADEAEQRPPGESQVSREPRS